MKSLDDKPLAKAIEWLAQRVYDTRDRTGASNPDFDYIWHRLDVCGEVLSELGAFVALKSSGEPSNTEAPQPVPEETKAGV